MGLSKQTKFVIYILLGLMLFNVLIFHYFANFGLVDSYYFVITMLTTVGFGDINLLESGPYMKIYGTFVMITGAAILAIVYSVIADYIISQKLNTMFGRSRIKMKNHTILIGWNKTAEATLDELRKISDVCVVTRKQNALNEINFKNVKVIFGDGTDKGVLLKAHLKFAKNVITCDDDDSRNVMSTLMVRKFNKKVKIISSANEVVNMNIIKEAGADEVISPDTIGGRLLTSAIFEPRVVDLINDATYVGAGTNIEQIRCRRKITVGAIIDRFQVAVLEKITGDKRIHNLKTTDLINPGDIIITFGNIKNIQKCKKFIDAV